VGVRRADRGRPPVAYLYADLDGVYTRSDTRAGVEYLHDRQLHDRRRDQRGWPRPGRRDQRHHLSGDGYRRVTDHAARAAARRYPVRHRSAVHRGWGWRVRDQYYPHWLGLATLRSDPDRRRPRRDDHRSRSAASRGDPLHRQRTDTAAGVGTLDVPTPIGARPARTRTVAATRACGYACP